MAGLQRRGEGVGAEGLVLRWLLARREVSLAGLRPVVSNIDSSPWFASCQTRGGGWMEQEGQGGVGWALGVCRHGEEK